jgi:UDPglucose 6-dehydrogenase
MEIQGAPKRGSNKNLPLGGRGAFLKQHISIVGLGGIGLSFAVYLANNGFEIWGVDIDTEKVGLIQQGVVPFYESGLEEGLNKALEVKRLHITNSYDLALEHGLLVFVIVGTPLGQQNDLNMCYVQSALETIGSYVRNSRRYYTVVVRSTLPPTTTERILKPLMEEAAQGRCGEAFGLCYNPEFVGRGNTLRGIAHPDFIVIGECNKRSGNDLEAFYRTLHPDDEFCPPIIRTNPTTAEMIKYTSVAFLMNKINFANVISDICQKTEGTDAQFVSQVIGLDRRINPSFLKPGLSCGGTCFTKEIRSLISYAEKLGVQSSLLKTIHTQNDRRAKDVVNSIKQILGEIVGKRVTVFGLAYKPNVDSIVNSCSIAIIKELLKEGAEITVHDPKAIMNSKRELGSKVRYGNSIKQALDGAECCLLTAGWSEYRDLSPEVYTNQMKNAILFDLARVYNPERFRSKLKYYAVGSCWRAREDGYKDVDAIIHAVVQTS